MNLSRFSCFIVGYVIAYIISSHNLNLYVMIDIHSKNKNNHLCLNHIRGFLPNRCVANQIIIKLSILHVHEYIAWEDSASSDPIFQRGCTMAVTEIWLTKSDKKGMCCGNRRQQTQNICIQCVQRRPNVFDVGQINVIHMFFVCWALTTNTAIVL